MKPVRDWRCPKCGMISPNVPVDVRDQWCPICGTPMEKIWTANHFILKGSDWPGKAISAGKTT